MEVESGRVESRRENHKSKSPNKDQTTDLDFVIPSVATNLGLVTVVVFQSLIFSTFQFQLSTF